MKYFVDEVKGTVVCKMSEDCYFGEVGGEPWMAKSPREEAVDYIVKRALKQLCEDARLPNAGIWGGVRHEVEVAMRAVASTVVARHVKMEYIGKAHCSGIDMASGKFDAALGTELAKSRCLMKYWADVNHAGAEMTDIFLGFVNNLGERVNSSVDNYTKREESVYMILNEVEGDVE